MVIKPQQPLDLDFAPSSIPAEYKAAIGTMAISWAALEAAVGDAIAGFTGLDAIKSAVMLAHETMPLRLDQLHTLASLAFGPDREKIPEFQEFKIIISNIKAAQSKRNGIVHNLWCIEPATGHVFRHALTARGVLKSGFVHQKAVDILTDAAFVHKISLDITVFLGMNGLTPKN